MTDHTEAPECNPHPCAPHGYDRSSSHSLDRHVCECEWWEPDENCAALELQEKLNEAHAQTAAALAERDQKHQAELAALKDTIRALKK